MAGYYYAPEIDDIQANKEDTILLLSDELRGLFLGPKCIATLNLFFFCFFFKYILWLIRVHSSLQLRQSRIYKM